MKNKLQYKIAVEFVKNRDWSGLAEAYHQSQVSWNAGNWEHFIEEIKRQLWENAYKVEPKGLPNNPEYYLDWLERVLKYEKNQM